MKLMIALMALCISGCFNANWPQNPHLSAHERYIRFVGLAVKDGGQKCADATNSRAELVKCDQVYNELRTLLVKLEEEP